MKTQRFGTLKGLTVPVLVYESYKEADDAAGKVGAFLEAGNSTLHYRGGPAGDSRAWICEMLEAKTKIPRKVSTITKTNKDGVATTVEKYDESELEYASRVCAEMKWEDLTQFQPDLEAWAEKAYDGKPLAVDIKVPERAPRVPPKLAQRYKDIAIAFLTGKKNLASVQKAFAKDLNGKQFVPVAGVPLTDEKNVEALGRLCKEFQEAQDVFGKIGA
jgi:hypothetical protein